MLAVRLELMTGHYVATRFNDRNRAEWPPHPARLFSAMVSTWADAEPPNPAERRALEWLESLPPPSLACSLPEDTAERAAVTHYVPNNDIAAPQELLPDERGRQARSFPTAIPPDPTLWFLWQDAEPEPATLSALDGILARVGRLGHSSTFVTCGLGEQPPPATLVPDDSGTVVLRVPSAGLLGALEDEHRRHQGSEPRVLPSATAAYASARTSADDGPSSVLAGPRYTLAIIERRVLPIQRALEVARGVRDCLLAHGAEPLPEVLTGHRPGAPGARTAPSTRAHMAVVPLPFVGREHADGSLQGVAVLLPSGLPGEERAAVAGALGHWMRDAGGELRLGRSGVVRFELAEDADLGWSLRRSTWAGPATTWVTVTPLALDRFPKGIFDRANPPRQAAATAAAADTVVRACTYLGLPEPSEVTVGLGTPLWGVPPARVFPAFRVGEGPARLLMHARIRFPEAVAGPVVIGAGRYLGQGLCFPLGDDGER